MADDSINFWSGYYVLDLNGCVLDFGNDLNAAKTLFIGYSYNCVLKIVDQSTREHLYTWDETSQAFVVDHDLTVATPGVNKLKGGVITGMYGVFVGDMDISHSRTRQLILMNGNILGNVCPVACCSDVVFDMYGGKVIGHPTSTDVGIFAGIGFFDETSRLNLHGGEIIGMLMDENGADISSSSQVNILNSDLEFEYDASHNVIGVKDSNAALVPDPEPEPSTDTEIKDDNQDKKEDNFPWAGVVIGGVAVTATIAAVAVACLAVRRK